MANATMASIFSLLPHDLIKKIVCYEAKRLAREERRRGYGQNVQVIVHCRFICDVFGEDDPRAQREGRVITEIRESLLYDATG